MTRAFSIVRRWSVRKVSSAASLKATALPAMTCISGPPCVPGKTFRSTEAARAPSASAFLMDGKAAGSSPGRSERRLNVIPPRGPRRVLWVVVVTRSACGNGLGWTSAATRPAMWAMSMNSIAPTSAAIAAIRSKSQIRG